MKIDDEKINTNRLEIHELEDLLGGSSLFPSKFEPTNYRDQEAEKVLQKASLYKIAEAGGDYKFKVPPLEISRRKLKKEKKALRESDAGPEWYHMKAPEMTSELKQDLNALRLRGHLDPKRFYRKSDQSFPKFFEIGTVVNPASDSNNLPRSTRNKSLAGQLLEEDSSKNFTTRKWVELMKSKTKKKHARSKGNKMTRKRKLGFK